MVATILCRIGLGELGLIISVAVLLFGCTAVIQNPMLNRKQKVLWFATILVLNWIGLLFYYYMFYVKER